MRKNLKRCWEGHDDPIHIAYHDQEWGVPLHDDKKIFEFLVLGGFQAGLTWWLILERREYFRKAFDCFDPQLIAKYSVKDIERLMETPKIIHNRQKILAAINNARCFIDIQIEFGSFDSFVWTFVEGKTIQNSFSRLDKLPTETKESRNLSEVLKKRGFQFVGPTICYAFMQATGLVNDHLVGCFRHKQIQNVIYNSKNTEAAI